MLFIDCVDFDFSLKIRKAGFKILLVGKAQMKHHLGESSDINSFAVHSHIRRYYMARNFLYISKTYIFPTFVFKLIVMQMLYFVLMLIYDKNPKKSLYFSLLGIKDFFIPKFGKLVRDEDV